MAKFILLVVILGISVPMQTLAFTYLAKMDTTSGFCEVSEELKIPVGETGYDDETCLRLECSEGMLYGAGCAIVSMEDMEGNCRLVRGEGHYPDCCLQPKCELEEENEI
uniref:U36-Liphistoxin-Lsp1b_1 n=2 Tax=Liphistius TaxID=62150 RepID=A0A4Q8K5S4_9ARAC